MRQFSTSTKLVFAAVFVLLVFVSNKINFSALVGAKNQFFTLFQFFGPIAGGILGSFVGAAVVLAASAINLLLNIATNNVAIEPLVLLRLLPMVFAAYYFGSKKRSLSLIVPIIAIALFNLHPVARQVWFYSLFWTIPIIAKFFQHRLLARSLGATFAAHSVGGAIWVWSVPMTPEMWIALIPVVIVERVLFAIGIAGSFIAANTMLAKVEANVPLVAVDKRYVLSRRLLSHI